MKTYRVQRIASIVTAAALGLTALSGCGGDDNDTDNNGSNANNGQTSTDTNGQTGTDSNGQNGGLATVNLQGEFAGAGASSIEAAMAGWVATFQGQHDAITVSYDPSGSGAGREIFLAGGVLFAGSDVPLNDDEAQRSVEVCGPEGAVDLPIYVSPIAVAFNLPGIDSLNMTAENIALIFSGEIDRWDDTRLAADNPGVDLPDLAVTPVHRTDNSGTTTNFTDYLHAVAPDAWPWSPAGTWPMDGGDSAQGTSGVIGVVNQTVGAVTYVDASQVGTMGTAALQVGGQWVPVSAQGAAIALDNSPIVAGRNDLNLAVEIDRNTSAEGAYPLILVAYAIACLHYDNAMDGEFVQSFLSFIASDAGQQLAQQTAGSSPLSADMAGRIQDTLSSITTGS